MFRDFKNEVVEGTLSAKDDFMKGVKYLSDGMLTVSRLPVVRKFYRKYFLSMILVLLPLYAVGLCLVLPIYAVFFAIDFFLNLSWLSVLPSFSAFATELFLLIPTFGLTFCRLFFSLQLDHLFFGALQFYDAVLAADLQLLRFPTLKIQTWSTFRRTWRRVYQAGFVGSLSFVPVFGTWVVPTAQWFVTRKQLGTVLAVFYAGLLLIPFVRPYSVVVLGSCFTANALLRELLEPYIGRVQWRKIQTSSSTLHTPPSSSSSSSSPSFNSSTTSATSSTSVSSSSSHGKSHESSDYAKRRKRGAFGGLFACGEIVMLGFAIPLLCLLSVPMLGPFLFPLAQAAVAKVIVAEGDKKRVTDLALLEKSVPSTSVPSASVPVPLPVAKKAE